LLVAGDFDEEECLRLVLSGGKKIIVSARVSIMNWK
jgi:hypothetical protein